MISALNSASLGKYNQTQKAKKPDNIPMPALKNKFALFDMNKSLINKLNISFKGYDGDPQPLKKMFWNLTGRDSVYTDNWTNEHLYQVGNKKWVNAPVKDLLKRTPEQVLQSLCTLIKPDNQYPGFPSYIPSPRYGTNRGLEPDKWGRHANYIEINPRALAKFENGRATEGLYGAMKMMTAIPTSPDSFANCIVLSQLYPAMWGEHGSLYGVNLHTDQQISDTLLSEGMYNKMGADEQVKAFNDFAHLLGFKTGFRMPMLAGEIQIRGNNFDWNNEGHRKAYVDACVWGLELGFDSIYFDSAKHVVDKSYMTQNLGDPPEPWQTKEILYYVRKNAHKPDASFIGEKCYDNQEYKNLGFTAGTDWGKADDFQSVRYEADKQKWSRDYAAGPEVSNDNDVDSKNMYPRLNKINSCLFGHDYVEDKLPSFMQLQDIFPLSEYTNTHEMMIHKKEMSAPEGWQECEKHWNGVFNTSEDARNYTQEVYHLFENFIRSRG